MMNNAHLRELWAELDDYEKELSEEASALERAWGALCDLDAENTTAYDELASAEELVFLKVGTMITLDIGGQSFVLPVELLTKDPFSVLAACCRSQSPLASPDAPNYFHFDRDWWIFRHIVTYMRTGLLPNEIEVLTELYMEATFYRLEQLKKAIEAVPVAKLQPRLQIPLERK